ncbi:unnamed protein product [Moneuplotes crassus]|uniref:Uncharacterized protein n=1 Tax=Euplotes crassus TaxID=5936 RepID=A0AAD1YA10_EUPCR|nr:unnamed protein product [Moneuplotes crassus]
MTKLTFNCIHKVLNGNDSDLNDGIIVQFLSVHSTTPEDKIYCKGTISCGNLSVTSVIRGSCAKESQNKYGAYEIKPYDIVKFNKWNAKKVISKDSKPKFFIILSGPYKILKTGLSTSIGDPKNYYDFQSNSEIPDPDPKNCVYLSSPLIKEETKDTFESPKITRRSRIKMDGSVSQDANDDYMPIKAISCANNDWIILAKVTKKTPIREYSNDRGPGKLFNIELTDGFGTQIQATAFNRAADKWFAKIEEGKIYCISNCAVRISNKKWTSIKNDYCLYISETSTIYLSEDQTIDIADIQICRTTIESVFNSSEGMSLDFVCIPVEDYGTREILLKSGESKKLRTLLVVDESKIDKMEEDQVLGIEVQIWGSNPENVNVELGKLLIIKRCRSTSFRDSKRISCSEDYEFYYFKDVKHLREMLQVFKWYKIITEGDQDIKSRIHNISSESSPGNSGSTPIRMIIQAEAENLEFYFCYVNLELIRSDERAVYEACPQCKKKVVKTLEGKYACERCETDFEEPKYTYMLSFKISDGFTKDNAEGTKWCNCFGEQGQTLMGKITAKEYYDKFHTDFDEKDELNCSVQLRELGKENLYKRYKMLIKKSETEFQGELRNRYTALKIFKEKVTVENGYYLNLLKEYQEEEEGC